MIFADQSALGEGFQVVCAFSEYCIFGICQNLRTSIDRNASSALYPQEVQVSAEARH